MTIPIGGGRSTTDAISLYIDPTSAAEVTPRSLAFAEEVLTMIAADKGHPHCYSTERD